MGTSGVEPKHSPTQITGSTPVKSSQRSTVRYTEMWPGIDTEYVSGIGIAQSFFYVSPGADPTNIALDYGASVLLQEDGSLLVPSADGFLSESAPIAWQVIDKHKNAVPIEFEVRGNGDIVGFRLGPYDQSLELIIDPTLDWVTALPDLESSKAEEGAPFSFDVEKGVATFNIDFIGNDTVALPNSVEFLNASQIDFFGNPGYLRYYSIPPLFFGSDGTALAYTGAANTFSMETWRLESSEIDGKANFTSTGTLYEVYPVQRCGLDGPELSPSNDDCIDDSRFGSGEPQPRYLLSYLRKTAADGTEWNVLLEESGGSVFTPQAGEPWPHRLPRTISFDPLSEITRLIYFDNNARRIRSFAANGEEPLPAVNIDDYLLGTGQSPDLDQEWWQLGLISAPDASFYGIGNASASEGAPVRPYSGGSDIVVSKYDETGALLWHTYLGSAGNDSFRTLRVDSSGDLYVLGTSELNWGNPVNDQADNQFSDLMIAKISSDGSLVWNTFVGFIGDDEAADIVADSAGNVYVYGAIVNPVEFNFGETSLYLARLSINGEYQDVRIIAPGEVSRVNRLAVGPDDSVYITGELSSDSGFWSGAIVPPPLVSDDPQSYFLARLFVNRPPVISVGDLNFTEDDPPRQIDPSAIAQDVVGSREFTTGSELRVRIINGAEFTDEVSVPTGVFAISNGSLVYFFGQVIGTIVESSGEPNDGIVTGNAELKILFNENSTESLVQEVVRSISYRTTSDLPTNFPREVQFTITDRHGATSTDQATINITSVPDATTTQLAMNPAHVPTGGAALLVADVAGGELISGAVSFFSGGSPIANCKNVVVIRAQATCLISEFAKGDFLFTAEYSGDTNYLASQSGPLLVSVPAVGGLSVSSLGNGSGTVSADVGPILCGSVCQHVYTPGTTVTLTAAPDSGSLFGGWSGAGCSGTGACSVILDDAAYVNALFLDQSAISSDPPQATCGDQVAIGPRVFDSEVFDCTASTQIDIGGEVEIINGSELQLNAPTVKLIPPLILDLESSIAVQSPTSEYATDDLYFVDTGSQVYPLLTVSETGRIGRIEADPLTNQYRGLLVSDAGGNVARVSVTAEGIPRTIYLNGTVIVLSDVVDGQFDLAFIRQGSPPEYLRGLDASLMLAATDGDANRVTPRVTESIKQSTTVQDRLAAFQIALLKTEKVMDYVSVLANPKEAAAIFALRQTASALDESRGEDSRFYSDLSEIILSGYNGVQCSRGSIFNCLSLGIDALQGYTTLAQFLVDDGLSQVADSLNLFHDPIPVSVVITAPRSGQEVDSYPEAEVSVNFTVYDDQEGDISVELACPSISGGLPDVFSERITAEANTIYSFDRTCRLPAYGEWNPSIEVTAWEVTQWDRKVSRAVSFFVKPSRGVKVEAFDGLAVEGSAVDDGIVRFSRIGNREDNLRVRYEVSGSATPSVDHSTQSGYVVIPAFVDWVDLRIEALQDNESDPGETVIVKLMPVLPGDVPYYVADGQDMATVSIGEFGNCDQQQVEGRNDPDYRYFDLGRTSGTFNFERQAFDIKDRFKVTYGGRLLYDSGCVSGVETIPLSYSGSTTIIEVEVIPNCDGTTSTGWYYGVSCPGASTNVSSAAGRLSIKDERELADQWNESAVTLAASGVSGSGKSDLSELIFESSFELRESGRTIRWDGGGDGVSWADERNWENDSKPESGDFVYVDQASGDPIIVDRGIGSVDLRSLDSKRSIDIFGGKISIIEALNVQGIISISGGTLVVDGELMLSP